DDTSEIFAFAGAASVAASIGAVGVSVSIGGSIARNEIGNQVSAFIDDAGDSDDPVTSRAGDISLTAKENARITVFSAAASFAPAGGFFAGVGVSGGGAAADNVILTHTDAHVDNSLLSSRRDVILDAQDASTINAAVAAASGSVGIGIGGVAVSLGASVAHNYIGWEADYHYTTSSLEKEIRKGDRVKLDDNYRTYYEKDVHDIDEDGDKKEPVAIHDETKGEAGSIYEYLGDAATLNLADQNYANEILWKKVDGAAESTPAGVSAYVSNSSITAEGALNLHASADETVNAVVFAGSAAIAGGIGAVGVTAAGAFAYNKTATDVKAFIDTVTGDGVQAGSISIQAHDLSTINAVTGSAALAASIGAVGVSVTIGAAIGMNQIETNVEAYILDAYNVRTTSGSIALEAIENATINALSTAASIAVGGGLFAGVAVGGGAADATNVILGKTNAYIANSTVSSQEDITIDAQNISTIRAVVAAVSAKAGFGIAGVAVSIGASVAHNYIGYDLLGNEKRNEAQAFIKDSSISAVGDLSLTAETLNTQDALFELTSLTVGELNDAAHGDVDDEDTGQNEELIDYQNDQDLLNKLRTAFSNQGRLLADGLTVTVLEEDSSWLVNDIDGNIYLVRKENGALNVYNAPQITAAVVAGSVA
ncbi:MAG: hypothetical protein ACP5I1_16950, partial [Candidatus Hinthialibacter sp.]